MNLKKWKPYLAWIGVAEFTGILAALLSAEGQKSFREFVEKPPFTPPDAVFPIVWTILYALMGISAARIWIATENGGKRAGLNLFVAQLIVNFFWTLIFFNAQAFLQAAILLVVLWILVALMILQFRRVDSLAAWLQIPYLIWLTFAAYLSFGVWLLNS